MLKKLTLGCIVLGLCMGGGCKEEDVQEAAEAARETADDVKEDLKAAAAKVKAGAQKAASDAKEAAQAAREKAKRMKEAAKPHIKAAKEKAGVAVKEVKDAAREASQPPSCVWLWRRALRRMCPARENLPVTKLVSSMIEQCRNPSDVSDSDMSGTVTSSGK